MTMPSKLFAFLKALPTILGCLVFLFSSISPFYFTKGEVKFIGSNYYWSYRQYSYGFLTGPAYSYPIPKTSTNYWFSNYWFTLWSDLPWILLSMFTIQVLTLIFGIASITFTRRILKFAPVLSCFGVLGLMIYAGQILYNAYQLGGCQLGYYLVFPSLALFLSAFIMNEVTKKQQTKDSISV